MRVNGAGLAAPSYAWASHRKYQAACLGSMVRQDQVSQAARREVYMANRSTNTFKKKEREEAKRRKRLAKEAKKLERKDLKDSKDMPGTEEDPDIAGIVPGPQPRSEDW